MINDKSQSNITKHLRCDELFYCKFIIRFAGERIFKIGEHFGKVTDEIVDCFMRFIGLALFSSKMQNSPHLAIFIHR